MAIAIVMAAAMPKRMMSRREIIIMRITTIQPLGKQ